MRGMPTVGEIYDYPINKLIFNRDNMFILLCRSYGTQLGWKTFSIKIASLRDYRHIQEGIT